MSAAFSVVALIAAFNEADIIEQVVSDLIDQGILVYFLDDGSSDRTVAAVEPYVGRGVLAIERRADGAAPTGFEWERILLRKTELARELDADWFIHHDADEFRESPWSHLRLKDAIEHVDALGFNAIDFTSLDFWPVHDDYHPGDDVRAAFTFYAEQAPYDRVQVRCWKKTDDLDLASSGGHDARFRDRRVFPVRFLLRHYPIRGQAHGERKVFEERQGRFLVHERARGWHVQYDDTRKGASFIRDPSTLSRYDPDAIKLALTLHHRGVEALEASLADAQSTIQTQDAELGRMQGELIARSAQAATLRDELARHAAQLAGLRSQLDELAARMQVESARLDARGRELHARGAELDARTAQVAGLTDALAHRTADIERLRFTVDERTRLLDELHHSASWRWTSPFRAIYRVLRSR